MLELGALAPDVLATGDDRVVVFLSMQWFMPSRNTAADLSTSFSQGALDALMASDTISDEVKARVRARLAAYGTIAEGEDNPVFGAASAVDGAARGAQGRVRLALELASGGPSNGMAGQTDAEVTAAAGDGGDAEPNWDALISEGRALAEADSTSNDAATRTPSGPRGSTTGSSPRRAAGGRFPAAASSASRSSVTSSCCSTSARRRGSGRSW